MSSASSRLAALGQEEAVASDAMLEESGSSESRIKQTNTGRSLADVAKDVHEDSLEGSRTLADVAADDLLADPDNDFDEDDAAIEEATRIIQASAAKRGGRSRGNVEGEYYGDDGGGRGSADDDDDDEDGRDDWKRQAARRRRELGGGRSGGQSGLAWDALLSTGSGGSGGGGGGGRRSKQRPGAGRTSFRPQRMHELAQPNRKGQGKGRNNTGASGGRRGPAFASQDDAENCTFQPFTNSKKGRKNKKKPGGGGGGAGDDGDDESKSAGGFDSFVARMESKENARRRLLDKTRGEKEYNAKIDKKVCVRCGQKQSYDEVMKRKKNCTSCGGAYRPAKSWAECKDAFNDRYKLALDKRSAALKRAKEEVRRAEQTRTRKTFDSYTGKVVEEVVTPPAWEDIADSFVDRLEEKNRERLERIAAKRRQREAEFAEATRRRSGKDAYLAATTGGAGRRGKSPVTTPFGGSSSRFAEPRKDESFF